MYNYDFSQLTLEDLEYAAPNHNREWCTCPYCEELRRRESIDNEDSSREE